MGWFCPEDFTLSDKSVDFAKKHGLNDQTIEDQFEAMQDQEFNRNYSDWDRVFRNWIRRGIKWGHIVSPWEPRVVEEVTDDQRQADNDKAVAQMDAYRNR